MLDDQVMAFRAVHPPITAAIALAITLVFFLPTDASAMSQDGVHSALNMDQNARSQRRPVVKVKVKAGDRAKEKRIKPKRRAKIVTKKRPAPKAKPPKAQKPGFVWQRGHYAWSPGQQRYKWVPGKWVKAKSAMRWIPGHYETKVVGNFRVEIWVPGRWEKQHTPVKKTKKTQPPPQPKIVTVDPPAPKAKPPKAQKRGFVWQRGHYAWSPGQQRYKWVPGKWIKAKTKHRWVPGHYETRVANGFRVKIWVPGSWQASGNTALTERNPPPPKSKPPSAKKRGFVWKRGHYAWSPGQQRYKWVPGKWIKIKSGKRWVPGRYEVRPSGNFRVKIWVPGSWR